MRTRSLRAVVFVLVLVLVVALATGCGRVGFALLAGDAGGRDSGGLDAGLAVDAASTSLDAMPTDGGAPASDAAVLDASDCSESPCRIATPQCGCGAGLACVSSAGVRTCAAPGTAGDGELCTTSADCAAGLNCSKFGARAPPGICIEYCTTAADCTGGGSCTQMLPPEPMLGLCSFSCDPVAQTGCPGGTACYLFAVLSVPDAIPSLASSCTTPSGLAEGAACTRPRDCAPGLTCVPVGAETVCVPQCVVGGAPCLSGSCGSYVPPLSLFGVEYGACI